MKFNQFCFLLLIALVLNVSACKNSDDDSPSNPCNTSFDQAALFQNVADNVIIPNFSELQEKVNDLSVETNKFIENPDEANLSSIRGAWLAAYLSWQKVAPYNFGPAEEVFLRSSVNNFPLNIEETNTNIQSGSYNFDLPDNFDKGFPALDYLLYGVANVEEEILNKYKNEEAIKYKQYLSDVVNDIKERVDHCFDGWTNGGYKETFINNKGTAAGTSLSLLINNFNENYELIKREKLGIPSGVLTLDFPNPDKVEAFFSGNSTALAVVALEATEQLYLGKSGIGLDDYLVEANAIKGGQPLNDLIKAQFRTAINTVKDLESPLSDFIDTDRLAVVNAYNEVTKQLVNIKTDMPSVLCVSITYIDNPSDSD